MLHNTAYKMYTALFTVWSVHVLLHTYTYIHLQQVPFEYNDTSSIMILGCCICGSRKLTSDAFSNLAGTSTKFVKQKQEGDDRIGVMDVRGV
jgi:hypothetical protein